MNLDQNTCSLIFVEKKLQNDFRNQQVSFISLTIRNLVLLTIVDKHQNHFPFIFSDEPGYDIETIQRYKTKLECDNSSETNKPNLNEYNVTKEVAEVSRCRTILPQVRRQFSMTKNNFEKIIQNLEKNIFFRR